MSWELNHAGPGLIPAKALVLLTTEIPDVAAIAGERVHPRRPHEAVAPIRIERTPYASWAIKCLAVGRS